MDSTPCPDCGSDDFATVLARTDSGEKQLRRYCRECERRSAAQAREELRPMADRLARLLISAGILLALLTLTADHLAISGRSGFGWRQITGAEIGFLTLVLGVMLRRRFLGVAGLFILVLSIGADILQVGRAPGHGWRSQLGFALAAAMLAGGMLWRRALARGSGLPSPRPPRSTA
jgi:hypothetical protein